MRMIHFIVMDICDNYLYFKPYLNMIYGGIDIDNVNSMIALFDVIKDKEVISLENYNKIYENACNMVNKNQGLLDEFHESSKKYIKRITNNL